MCQSMAIGNYRPHKEATLTTGIQDQILVGGLVVLEY